MQQASTSPFLDSDNDGAVTSTTTRSAGFAARRRVPIDELRARIRRYNGGLDPDGETFGAALILVAACEYGQNVDLLARRTGLPRPFVARCARRLIDNGVWVGGRTVAEWAPEDPASGSFWSDAAVAEGKMCRRTRTDGSLEWAPAGFWNKNFHFLDPEAESRLGNQYFDSAPPGSAASETGEQVEDEGDTDGLANDAASPEPVDQTPGHAFEPIEESIGQPVEAVVESTVGAVSAGPESSPVPEPDPGEPENVPPLHHIFRDAVWLG
ncbi:MAG: hypothetical protein PVH00_01225 [Gemmatimonadota bacterium]